MFSRYDCQSWKTGSSILPLSVSPFTKVKLHIPLVTNNSDSKNDLKFDPLSHNIITTFNTTSGISIPFLPIVTSSYDIHIFTWQLSVAPIEITKK